MKALVPQAAPAPPLREHARDYACASRADNTINAYRGDWSDFEEFCHVHRNTTLPATPECVVDYVTLLADSGVQKVSTIQQKVAAIAYRHKLNRLPSPTDDPQVKVVMAGIRRKLGTRPKRMSPIAREDLVRLVAALPDDLAGARDRAIILLGFAGAFRRSELVALEVGDVVLGSREMAVTLRRSKTDQEDAGFVKHIPMIDDVAVCPVRALRTWLRQTQIDSGPLFRAVDRWGHLRKSALTDQVVARIVKGAAVRAGLDAKQFSGHSLRAGFVTQAAADGTQEWMIQEVTGHKSPAVLRSYIRDARRGQVEAIRRAMGE